MKRRMRIPAFLLVLCLLVGVAPRVRADGAMTSSQKMVDVLKTMEGFYAAPYWDYKQWTVGYGSECPPDILAAYQQHGTTITREKAEELLRNELVNFEADVHNFMNKHGLKLKQQEFDALVSFSYNCGSSWMNSTNGYLNVAVRAGFRGSDFLYAMCLYGLAGGDYILQNRRLCEANMYLNGVYRAYNDGKGAIPDHYRYVFLDGNGGTLAYPICGYDAKEKTSICVEFSDIPTGKKADGTPYPYTLEGWYTAEGKKVKALDGSLGNGTVLYAKWTDYEGKQVNPSKGEPVSLEVRVTADTVNVRTGPATFYPKQGSPVSKGTKLQLSKVYDGWGLSQHGWVKLTNTDYTSVIASQPFTPKAGTVTGSKVNYRNGPSTDGTTVMGQKQKGDRVTIVQMDYSSDPAWGQMDNGYWIRMDYVQLDEDVKPAVTGVYVVQKPRKTQYLHQTDTLRPEGGVLMATLADGTAKAVSMKRSMITAFSTGTMGKTTVRGNWEGFSFSFSVKIVGHPVTFQYSDGTLIETISCAYGAVPEAPIPPRPDNLSEDYTFRGWDKKLKACTGATTYTAVFSADFQAGDLSGDGSINSLDGLLLLRYLNGWKITVTCPEAMDVNADGTVNSLDGLILLRYLNGWNVTLP